MSERMIHSFTFRPDGLIEVSFAEDREEVESGAMLRTVVMEETVWQDELDDLRENLNDLIDEFLVYLRNEDARRVRLEASRRSVPEPEAPKSSFEIDDF